MNFIADLKSNELAKRVVTGAIGATFLILLIACGGWLGIFLLTAVLSLGMIHEFGQMVFSLSDAREKRLVLLGTAWLIAFVNLIAPRIEYDLLLVSFFGLFAYFLFSANRHGHTELNTHFRELMDSVFGLVYLVFLMLFLPRIHESHHGTHWTILFFLIVWAGDTGAYFAGKKFGRRKLYPRISPKKTMEGALGGLVSGLIIAILYKIIFFHDMRWPGVLMIPLLVGPVSQVGDLAESFMKRAFDRKDSGVILPGHGGFLDRFDGVVFSLPIMYACLRIFS